MTLAQLESFLSQPPERLKAQAVDPPGKKIFFDSYQHLFVQERPIFESPTCRLYLKASPFEQHAVLFEDGRCYEYTSHTLEHFCVYLCQLARYLANREPAALAGLRRFCHTELAEAHRNRILWECLHLSGSTLATLTGLRSYAEQERVQQDLLSFVSRNWKASWHSWMDAWKDFRERSREQSTLEL